MPINPYVGPHPFKKGQQLYGRDKEVEELLDLLMAERIVLLYSPSGAGKTSLLEAGLLPRMEKEGFRPLPVLRVSRQPAGDEMPTVPITNRYILSLLLYLEDGLPPGVARIAPDDLAIMKLTDYLKRQYESESDAAHHVLIFDQFEEILTLHPTVVPADAGGSDGDADDQQELYDEDEETKRAFFQQVGAALRDRRRWAIFAMREDYVAALHPYLSTVPTRFGNTYRLDLLDRKGALEAVTRPAHAEKVEFTAEAAEDLVNNLRLTRLASPTGPVKVYGPYVEPVQLQVVCWSLWDKLRPEAGQVIGADAVKQLGDPDHALMNYYDEQVRTVAASRPGEREREIRDWFDRYLITVQGLRGRVLQGDPSQTVTDRVATALVNAHLIREDKRGGVTWFELAHDRLIDPVRKSNDAWDKTHLQPLQLSAAIWEAAGRPTDNYLLRHQELADAEAWATAHAAELNRRDEAFLDACRGHRERGEQKKIKERAARYLWLALALAVVILCLAGLSFYIAAKNKDLAGLNKDLTAANDQNDRKLVVFRCNDLTQAALDKVDTDAEFSVRLSLKSLQILQGIPAVKEDDPNEKAAVEKARKKVVGALNRGIQILRVEQTLGHDAGVNAVAYSHNGKWIASASDDGIAIVWDAATGKLVQTLPHLEEKNKTEKNKNVNGVAFSQNDAFLATAGDDGTVKVWDLIAKNPPRRLDGCGEMSAVAFSRDPKEARLAGGSSDGTILIWALSETATAKKVLTGHTGQINAVAFSPDGKLLATASKDKTVKLWDAANNYDLVQTLCGNQVVDTEAHSTPAFNSDQKPPHDTNEAVAALAFSPNGEFLAAGGDDTIAWIWKVEKIKVKKTELPFPQPRPDQAVKNEAAIHGISFSQDGKYLATVGRDMQVKVWVAGTMGGDTPVKAWAANSGAPKLKLTLKGHSDIVTGVAFDPNKPDRLATSSDDHTVIVWDLGPRTERLDLTASENISKAALNTDGTFAVGGSNNGITGLWNLEQKKPLGQNKPTEANLNSHTQAIRSIAFSPDGKTLLTGSLDKTAIVWNLESGQIVLKLTSPDAIWDVAYSSPDGKNIAAGSQDGTVRTWDATSGRELLSLKTAVLLRIYGIAYSKEGSRLAAGGGSVSGTGGPGLVMWDLPTRKPLAPMLGLPNFIIGLAYSPDGKHLAATGLNAMPRLWDVAAPTAKEPKLLRSESIEELWFPSNNLLDVLTTMQRGVGNGWLGRVVFTPNGNLVAAGGADGKIRFWDAASGVERGVLVGRQGAVWGVAFNPDGTRLAAAGSDGTVCIWDVGSGEKVRQWTAHLGGAYAVAFSPDGTRVATGGQDNAARVWDAADGRLLQNFKKPGPISVVAVHPQGKSFAVVRSDNSAVVCEGSSGQPLFNSLWHQKSLRCVAYRPDGKRIALADSEGTVEIWDAEKGELVQTAANHASPILCLTYSTDGKRLLTGYSDRKAMVWDPETGDRLQTFAGPEAHSGVAQSGHATSVTAVAFGPDGDIVATGGADYAVKLWKVTGHKDDESPPIRTLAGHNGSITALAFSAHGERLASASADKTVKIWDLNGRELFSFAVDDLPATALAFKDVKHLVTINPLGTVHVFILDLDEAGGLAKERISQHEPLTDQKIEEVLHGH